MYALILVLLILFIYWYSRRTVYTPEYVQPEYAQPEYEQPETSIEPSPTVPDITSTDVMNTQPAETTVISTNTDTEKKQLYERLLNVAKKKNEEYKVVEKQLRTYTDSFDKYKKEVEAAEISYNEANKAASLALLEKNNAIASKNIALITTLTSKHVASLKIADDKFKLFNSKRLELLVRTNTLTTLQTNLELAKKEAKKADAAAAAYGKINAIASAFISAFGNKSRFLNLR